MMMTSLIRILVCVALAVVIFGIFLYWVQERLIYHPQPYKDDIVKSAPERTVKITYDIPCGQQTAWYVPPRSGSDAKAVPATLWFLFGGNGSLALFWADTVDASPDPDAAYVLFDYPSYGQCEGKPSPATISESSDEMIVAVAQYLNISPARLKERPFRIMGHSLGAATALDFATRHPVDRAVLISPFTTTRAMADLVVSPWFGWMISHRFDNLKALDALALQNPRPSVVIIHGTADDIIPISMARELKARHPDMIELVERQNYDHVNVLNGVESYMGVKKSDFSSDEKPLNTEQTQK